MYLEVTVNRRDSSKTQLFLSHKIPFTERASGLHHVDIRYKVKTGNKVTFHFQKLHKNWTKEYHLPLLTIMMSNYLSLCHLKGIWR